MKYLGMRLRESGDDNALSVRIELYARITLSPQCTNNAILAYNAILTDNAIIIAMIPTASVGRFKKSFIIICCCQNEIFTIVS